jgi:SAM-dependent methyltransferase
MLAETGDQYRDSRKLSARARLHREFSTAEVPWHRWVAEKAALPAGGAILDVGCGPAWFWTEAEKIAPPDLRLTLVDSSAGMVEEALERVRGLGRWNNVEGVVADAMRLPFADASFDAAIAMHMLYHATDPEAAVAELARVLKPGGRLVVTLNGRDNLAELYALGHTIFGGYASDPSAETFGLEIAEPTLRRHFATVELEIHPDSIECTDPEVVLDYLQSFPPGDTASTKQVERARTRVADAFGSNGRFSTRKRIGLFRCTVRT